MKLPHFLSSYLKHCKDLMDSHDEGEAMSLAVACDSTSYSRHSIHVLESSVRPMNARERANRLEMRQEARRGIREADDPGPG